MNVVVVESPAKAKAINKYLGNDFVVLASFGHVRDLPSKDGSVQPDKDFNMAWEVDAKSKKRIRDIADAVGVSVSTASRALSGAPLRSTRFRRSARRPRASRSATPRPGAVPPPRRAAAA